ncbi:hypothetical protein GCM10007877_23230 [Marinibactrum halimedae]|uniref:ATPase n=1 Tax=Marinibactrum halimedae TaxID=1444977 RepID=A0AA37TCE2_9GAMM|nr:hypothetical protein GCM10007877_23230 [Marinibactrum halimedae]
MSVLVIVGYLAGAFYHGDIGIEGAWGVRAAHSIHELLNTMWWGVIAAIAFVGLLAHIPQSIVLGLLGKGGSLQGIFRATAAGVLLDLCSHGILMVGTKLYEKGASLGQVMAFLIASPWNSISLTLILIALIGWQWTLAFIALSMLLALTVGVLFEWLCHRGVLPQNPHTMDHNSESSLTFRQAFKQLFSGDTWQGVSFLGVFKAGFSGARIVLRWLFFGILLAAAIRTWVDLQWFQQWFGPTLVGLLLTMVAATVIEVCSEGSTPIAADFLTRANAPGNSFAFLMTGVSTDYTEVMVLKETTRSWKIALFLPLLSLPQVIVIAFLLNQF